MGPAKDALERLNLSAENLNKLPVDERVNKINQAIRELDQVIQQNAAAAEEASETSRNLAQQSQQLTGVIAYFGTQDANPGQAGSASQENEMAVDEAMVDGLEAPYPADHQPMRYAAE